MTSEAIIFTSYVVTYCVYVCLCIGEELGVITGYGSGSVKKEARIKPVVKKYLTRNNIW